MDTATDKLNRYRDIIESLLTDVRGMTKDKNGYEYRTLLDRRSDSYALICVGWEGKRRVHHFVIHLEILNGKVWLQEDNTDLVIAEELERAGIPKSDIVLGFHPADVRPFTEYAVAA
jgi:hypothetical protein